MRKLFRVNGAIQVQCVLFEVTGSYEKNQTFWQFCPSLCGVGRSFRENPFLAVRRDDFGNFGVVYPNGAQPDFCGKNLLAGFAPFDRIRNDFSTFCDLFFHIIGGKAGIFPAGTFPFCCRTEKRSKRATFSRKSFVGSVRQSGKNQPRQNHLDDNDQPRVAHPVKRHYRIKPHFVGRAPHRTPTQLFKNHQ